MRRWIDDAIKEEKMTGSQSGTLQTDPSAQNLEIPGVQLGNMKKPPVSKKKKKSRSKSKGRDTSSEQADVKSKAK